MAQAITRRTLLAGAAGVAALSSCSGQAQPQGGSSSAAGGVAAMPIQTIDLHADTIDVLGMVAHAPYSTFKNKFSGDLAVNNAQISADRMGNVQWVQCYAIWLPDDNSESEIEKTDLGHVAWYREAVAWFKGQMEQHANRFAQVRIFADIPAILAEGKVPAILAVENAACLDEGIAMVDEFAQDGVMIAGITWNGRNVLGSGNNHVDESLTSLGKRYLAALEDHGIVADVSHLNEKGFWDVEELATRPYLATHSNARSVCDHLRNLTDKQFAAIAARGGVVGLNFHEGFVHEGGHVYTFEELAAHVDHWLELGGEDVIALGSDRDGSNVPTWLADCSAQSYLFKRFSERLGEPLTRKLFFENAMGFFERYAATAG